MPEGAREKAKERAKPKKRVKVVRKAKEMDGVLRRMARTIQASKHAVCCNFCGRTGHYEDSCWSKKKQERKKHREHSSNANTPPQTQSSMNQSDQGKKRKLENITFIGKMGSTIQTMKSGRNVSAVLDTGATTSAVSSRIASGLQVAKEMSIPVKMGDGTVVYSEGIAEVELAMGNLTFQKRLLVLKTAALALVSGMDWLL